MAGKPSFKQRQQNRGKSLADYWPLASLILVAAAAAYALYWQHGGGLMGWMQAGG